MRIVSLPLRSAGVAPALPTCRSPLTNHFQALPSSQADRHVSHKALRGIVATFIGYGIGMLGALAGFELLVMGLVTTAAGTLFWQGVQLNQAKQTNQTDNGLLPQPPAGL